MISLQVVERRREDLAFAYADQARTRGLSVSEILEPTITARPGLPPREELSQDFQKMYRNIPAGVTLVQYSLLPDHLFIWIIRREGMSFYAKPLSRAVLEEKVQQLRTPRGRRSTWQRTSSFLYDLLLNPWITQVENDELLVFIPDKSLHAACFSCLRNPQTGRYVLEDREMALAPSVGVYLAGLESRRRLRSLSEETSILVIGNPSLKAEPSMANPRLPGAEREAQAIARLYPQSRLLTRGEAHRTKFQNLARGASRIHFAGPAVTDLQNPIRSGLLLAPSGPHEGALYAEDIYRMQLDRTELVVLSACGTRGSSTSGGEGVTSLARAFQAAGVPLVVASLWEVNDSTTPKLFEEFHRHLLTGAEPASALREAQLTLLGSGESPEVWAAFQVIGASMPEN